MEFINVAEPRPNSQVWSNIGQGVSSLGDLLGAAMAARANTAKIPDTVGNNPDLLGPQGSITSDPYGATQGVPGYTPPQLPPPPPIPPMGLPSPLLLTPQSNFQTVNGVRPMLMNAFGGRIY